MEKVTKSHKFRYIVLFSSLLATIISLFISTSISSFLEINLVALIPFFYGMLFILFVPKNIFWGPGFIMLNIVFFIRYIIFIPIFFLNDFETKIVSYYEPNYVLYTFFLILIELIVIFIVINIVNKRMNSRDSVILIIKNNNFYFFSIIFILSIIVIARNSSVLSNFNFVFNPSKYIDESVGLAKSEFIYGSGIELELLKYTIIIFNLYFLEKYYFLFLNTQRQYYMYLAILPILFSSLFYIGISRSSLLLPLLTYIFVFNKFFPRAYKFVTPLFITYLVVSMTVLSIFKQFRTDSIAEGTEKFGDINNFTNILNDYTSCFPNVYQGFVNSEVYKNKRNYETVFNDYLSVFPFLHRFADLDNRTTVHFNLAFSNIHKTSHRILPLTIQGYMHFGLLFFYIYAVLTVLLVLKFDDLYRNSGSIYYSFLYAFLAIGIGFSIGHTFTAHIIGRLIKFFIPMYIIFLINRKFRSKSLKKI
ncbi:MAG: hypothetical protein IPO21_00050 [Bacteroidales bacterium]|nr:hypothetical protein [Bacteroidales bacterium]